MGYSTQLMSNRTWNWRYESTFSTSQIVEPRTWAKTVEVTRKLPFNWMLSLCGVLLYCTVVKENVSTPVFDGILSEQYCHHNFHHGFTIFHPVMICMTLSVMTVPSVTVHADSNAMFSEHLSRRGLIIFQPMGNVCISHVYNSQEWSLGFSGMH